MNRKSFLKSLVVAPFAFIAGNKITNAEEKKNKDIKLLPKIDYRNCYKFNFIDSDYDTIRNCANENRSLYHFIRRCQYVSSSEGLYDLICSEDTICLYLLRTKIIDSKYPSYCKEFRCQHYVLINKKVDWWCPIIFSDHGFSENQIFIKKDDNIIYDLSKNLTTADQKYLREYGRWDKQ